MNGKYIFCAGILVLLTFVSSAPKPNSPTPFPLIPGPFLCPLFVRKRRQLLPDGLPDGLPKPKDECRTDEDCRVLYPNVQHIKCCYSGGIQGLPYRCFNVGQGS